MNPTKSRVIVALLLTLAVVFTVPQAFGFTVLKMSLEELCDRADKIVRAEVVAVNLGTVTVGGAEFPTTTYVLDVKEALKGDMPAAKDGITSMEVTMLGSPKPQLTGEGPVQAVSAVPQLPLLQTGSEYVLMTTAPSAAGLSTTVGLGQGCFSLFQDGKAEMAVNELNNQGLFDGPVEYTVLSTEIQNALSQ